MALAYSLACGETRHINTKVLLMTPSSQLSIFVLNTTYSFTKIGKSVFGSGLGSVIGPVSVRRYVRPDLPVRSGVRPDHRGGGPVVRPDLIFGGPVVPYSQEQALGNVGAVNPIFHYKLFWEVIKVGQ